MDSNASANSMTSRGVPLAFLQMKWQHLEEERRFLQDSLGRINEENRLLKMWLARGLNISTGTGAPSDGATVATSPRPIQGLAADSTAAATKWPAGPGASTPGGSPNEPAAADAAASSFSGKPVVEQVAPDPWPPASRGRAVDPAPERPRSAVDELRRQRRRGVRLPRAERHRRQPLAARRRDATRSDWWLAARRR